MKDLIIIIIAITLSAVVGGATFYYGGNGFMASVTTASATKIINYLSNYVQAINMWSQRNGGYPSPANNFPVVSSNGSSNPSYIKSDADSFLMPHYIQQNSAPERLLTTSTYFIYKDTVMMQNPIVVGMLKPSDTKLCGAIETLRTHNPPSLRTWSTTTLHGDPSTVNPMLCGNVGCIINNGDWGSTAAYGYVVYVRIHGPPNINNADVNPVTCN